jgi:hypothetical protein
MAAFRVLQDIVFWSLIILTTPEDMRAICGYATDDPHGCREECVPPRSVICYFLFAARVFEDGAIARRVAVCLDFSFSLQYHHNAHDSQHHRLQPWVLAEHDGHVTHSGDVSSYTANDVFFLGQVALAACVKFCVVCDIVVAFCEEFRCRLR